ncbi:MAG: hypothetical protein PVSMB10_17700 [Pseudarthrobacter sp.]
MSFFSFDPLRSFLEALVSGIQAAAGQLALPLTGFLLSTTDVLDHGRPFTESSAITRFQPVAVAIADAALVAAITWGAYHIMFAHGVRSLYTVRILLPRILLAFLLANFSQPLLQGAVDVNNALDAAVLSTGTGFDPASLLNGGRDLGSGPAFSIIVTAALFCGYGVLGIAYTVRYSLLIVLAILAPLAALVSVLPDTHHYARKWGALFVSTLLMQPLQLLVLQVGLQLEVATSPINPLRHLFALATLLIAFKVPGALHTTSSAGTHALATVKHYAHLATRTGHLA